MNDPQLQASSLADKLEAAAASWPTVYSSDRENIALLSEAAAALRAAPECPEGFVMVRKEAIDWLNGETEEGFECPPDRYFRGEPPRYWWRSVFREKAGLAARPQGVKDGN